MYIHFYIFLASRCISHIVGKTEGTLLTLDYSQATAHFSRHRMLGGGTQSSGFFSYDGEIMKIIYLLA